MYERALIILKWYSIEVGAAKALWKPLIFPIHSVEILKIIVESNTFRRISHPPIRARISIPTTEGHCKCVLYC